MSASNTGWTSRILVLATLAALTVLEVPGPRRVVPLTVLVAAPSLYAVARWTEGLGPPRAHLRPALSLLCDVALLSILLVVAPELRGAVLVISLSLLLKTVATAPPVDVVVAMGVTGWAWVATATGPEPSTVSVLAAVAVTAVAIGGRASILRRASVGDDRRMSLLSGRSHAVLRGVAESVFVTTPDGVIVDANDPARSLSLDGGDLVGRPCSTVYGLHAEGGPLDCSTCPLLSVSGQDVEVWRIEGESRRTMVARVEAILDHQGRTVEVLHSLRDVTEITRARDAQNLFLATASHELRTPLTVIRGSIETVAERPELRPEERDLLLRAAVNRAIELDVMITRLLDTSRLWDGAIEIELADVDIDAVVGPRVRSIDGASSRHDFSWTVPDDLPRVVADEHALGVVIDHLLENARKYQPDGGLIEARVHVDESHVSLAVRDHGLGMTAEQQLRCFDRFWQADIGDRRRFGGSGVGLYLVRGLVTAMGASIDVWSQLGRGSQFTVHLRRVDASAPEPTTSRTNDRRGRSMIDEFMTQVGVTPGRRS